MGEIMLCFRCDEPPFDDVNVRRALTIGTNRDEFRAVEMIPPGMSYVAAPVELPGDPSYTPLEELPEDVQILYEYDTDEAKRLLAEAGYPEGLATRVMVQAGPVGEDQAALLKYQWAKIGVELEIDALESVDYLRARYPLPEPTYHGVMIDQGGCHDPMVYVDIRCYTMGYNNYGAYSNPEMDKLIDPIRVELDPDEQIRLFKEITPMVQYEAIRIHLSPYLAGRYWWPWVKNYYGEYGVQDDAFGVAP
ncbi:unnamed protein product, partial [marine sediment metagenome]